jgi:hypothetical protein
MIAVMPCVGIPGGHSIDFDGLNTHQGYLGDHLAVYVRSWIDAAGRRNMDNPFGAVVGKDPYLYGEEYEKD